MLAVQTSLLKMQMVACDLKSITASQQYLCAMPTLSTRLRVSNEGNCL